MDNDSTEGRAKNRRTRIVVLPKLDQFYELIEKGMKAASN
jgi:chemotaxis protein MotB